VKRRVLIVCYYFPPLGLAGVTRPLQLYSRLAKLGYECHVLTVKPVTYYAYEPELLIGLNQSGIHRAGSRDPQRLMYLCGMRTVSDRSTDTARRLKSSIFPDSKRGWIRPAVRLGRKLIKEQRYDLLLSTSPPISAHVVASKLAAETGVKWVADFRDLWTTESIEESYGHADMVERGRLLLNEIESKAASITAVNRSVAEYVGASNVITNGFDPVHAKLWSATPDRSRFVIGLLATFNDRLPVEPLLNCMTNLREKVPSIFHRIRLLQVGRVDREWLATQLKGYDLANLCDMHGLQSRARTVDLLSASSLFYIGVQPGWGDRITTARVYDLLASGRPILAYAKQTSELASLLAGVTDGRTFTEDSISEATDFIRELAARHADGELRFEPIPEYAKPYSWDIVAAQFAALFDRIL